MRAFLTAADLEQHLNNFKPLDVEKMSSFNSVINNEIDEMHLYHDDVVSPQNG